MGTSCHGIVLLVEDDAAEAEALVLALADPRAGPCRVEWVTSLGDGLKRLETPGITANLLDLFLPDSQGMETFERLFSAAPRVPILVLSSLADEDLALEAFGRG